MPAHTCRLASQQAPKLIAFRDSGSQPLKLEYRIVSIACAIHKNAENGTTHHFRGVYRGMTGPPLTKPPNNVVPRYLTTSESHQLGKRSAYPAPSLVVLQVHQHASLLLGTSHVVLLPLLGIHKLLGKTVPILHVIPAAAPQPVSGQVLGPGRAAAAAAGQLSFAAGTADGVHHPGSTDSIGESGLSATCKGM